MDEKSHACGVPVGHSGTIASTRMPTPWTIRPAARSITTQTADLGGL